MRRGMATVASRQVANSAWLAELSKIAAKSVTTYKSCLLYTSDAADEL